jgi:hypothetical protein
MARFRAATALNLRWQAPNGEWIELVNGDKQRRTAIAAGESFEVPDHVAGAFLEAMGPRPGIASQSSIARIPGLIRLDDGDA